MIRGTVIDVFYESDDGAETEIEKGLCVVIRPDVATDLDELEGKYVTMDDDDFKFDLGAALEEANAEARGSAKVLRNWFVALREVGFTDEQALDVCKEMLRLALQYGRRD